MLGLCLLTVAGVSAQKSLVKEVEGKVKAKSISASDARKQLAPALTNPESADDAQTWFVAGTIEYGDYDELYKQKAVGQAVNPTQMGEALINGYNYFIKALPLDSVAEVDKNGAPKLNKDGSKKIKTKYSKDILKTVKENINGYLNVGQDLWDAKDYKNAYLCWNIFSSMPTNPMLAAAEIPQHDQNSLGQILYFEALAAWQAEMLDTALESFDKAVALGYQEPALYDYAISVAAQKEDTPRVLAYAETANKLYGDSISKFLEIIINDKINNKDFDAAQTMLDQAIKVSPDNPQLYDVLGILCQSKDDLAAARSNFEKAYQLDPASARFNLDLGRVIYAQAVAKDEASNQLSQAEYDKVRTNEIDPMLKEAIPYLEVALKDDSTFDDARRLLRSLYYSLNDDANLKRIESM